MDILENILNHTLQNSQKLRFEVLTAVVMNSSIFWDVMLCSWLKVSRRFGGIYRLHLRGRRISRTRNQREASSKKPGGLFRHVPSKRQPAFNWLHGVISQEIEMFRNWFNYRFVEGLSRLLLKCETWTQWKWDFLFSSMWGYSEENINYICSVWWRWSRLVTERPEARRSCIMLMGKHVTRII
jgi:hypothetical protein